MDPTRSSATPVDAAPNDSVIERFHAAMAAFWHPVIRSEAVPADRPVAARLLGRDLVLARLGDGLCALDDRCRHFQARLSLGTIVEHGGAPCLQCPYHGWTYRADGRCVRIPQLGPDRRIPRSAVVPAYPTAERYGLVWVCMSGEPRFPLPDYPEHDDPTFRTVSLTEDEATRASAPRMIMGTLDNTHFPWVHEGILGSRDRPAPPDHAVRRQGPVLECRYRTRQPPSHASTDLSRRTPGDDSPVEVGYANFVAMPGTIRLVKDSDSGRYVIWLATCPTDHDRTVNFWAFSRNYDRRPARDAEFIELGRLVREQDRPIIESQRPVLVPPLEAGVSLAISPGDAPLIEYQRWLGELGIAVQ